MSLSYAPIDTHLGPGFFAYTPDGVVRMSVSEAEQTFLRRCAAELGETPVRAEPSAALLRRVRACIDRGDGSAVDWSRLGEFQREALQACAEIPYGGVRSYAWVAGRIGKPKAARAVGTAMARNPLPLLIPCHRVIRSDGELGEYGIGGAKAKRSLLEREGVLL